MAYGVVAFANGEVLPASKLTQLMDNDAFLKAAVDPLSASAAAVGRWTLSAAVVVASGTFVGLPFDTAVGAIGAGLSNTGGAITVAQAGVYVMTANALYPGTAGGVRRSVLFTRNCATIPGTGILGSGEQVGGEVAAPTGSIDQVVSTTSPPIVCAAGDILRAFAFHDAGVNISVQPGSATTYMGRSLLSVRRVA